MRGDFFVGFGNDFIGGCIDQIIGWMGVVYVIREEFGCLIFVFFQFVFNGVIIGIYDVFLVQIQCIKQGGYRQFMMMVDVCENDVFGVEFEIQLRVVIWDNVVGKQQFIG